MIIKFSSRIDLAIVWLSRRGNFEFDENMSPEVCATVAVAVLMSWEESLRSGVINAVLVDRVRANGFVPNIFADMSAGMDTSTRTAFVSALELISTLALSEEASLLSW